jgi:hypothetical protein
MAISGTTAVASASAAVVGIVVVIHGSYSAFLLMVLCRRLRLLRSMEMLLTTQCVTLSLLSRSSSFLIADVDTASTF